MSISLSDGTTTVQLPDDLQWVDEFSWSDVEQDKQSSLTGALIVQQGVKTAGRPITLASNGASWVSRSKVTALQAFYNAQQESFTLSHYGTDYTVQFERPGGFDAKEVLRKANPDNGHLYTITLKFFEV